MNILITSVGRRTYMVEYFKNALAGLGIVHASNSSFTYALSCADKSVITPLIYDENYIDFLLSYCTENKIDALISLFDISLPILARNKAKFKDIGVQLLISDYETVKTCNDKWLTYEFLNENDINTPQTYLTISQCIEDLCIGCIQFPLIVKPRWGMGSIGIYKCNNQNELEILYLKSKNDILSTYLNYETNQYLDRGVIIQEMISGDEYGLDILNDLKGNFISCIPKFKIQMRNGETDSAEIIDNSSLFEIGKKLSDKLHHIANLDVDILLSNEKFYVIDLNCRFGGQYPFSHMAGVDFPKALINMLQGKSIEDELITAKAGTIGFKDIKLVKMNT